eukprot:5014677-Amphidinium_carterae.4
MTPSTTGEFPGVNQYHKRSGKDEATSNWIYAWTCARASGLAGNRWTVVFATELGIRRFPWASAPLAKTGPAWRTCACRRAWMAYVPEPLGVGNRSGGYL